jgi:hypothetical protein
MRPQIVIRDGVGIRHHPTGEFPQFETESLDIVLYSLLSDDNEQERFMDEPKYKIGKVAQVSGIPVATLKNWERKERQLIKREDGEQFTFRRAFQVVLTAALVRMGQRLEVAANAAFQFTDIGNGALAGLNSDRGPGEMFDEGWTVLCIYPGDLVEVKNVMPKDAATLLFTPLGHNRADAATLLNVTFLGERVREALES